ncbi:MAG: AraC family transcriptional regulator [Phycisphaeraceae bacterium]
MERRRKVLHKGGDGTLRGRGGAMECGGNAVALACGGAAVAPRRAKAASKPPQSKGVPLADWPALLMDAKVRLRVDCHGTPGRFVAPPSWKVDMAGLDSDLLYYIASGSFDAGVGPVRLTVTPGSLLWCAQGQALDFRRRDAQPLVLLRFRLNAYRGRRSLGLAPPQVYRRRARGIGAWFERIIDEVADPIPTSELHLRGLLLCLMTEVVRLPAEDGSEAAATAEGDEAAAARTLTAAQCRAVERYGQEHLPHWPKVAQLAQAARLSPDYFSRLFRQTYGHSARDYVVRQRIGLARLYLAQSTHTIAEIAQLLGYRDVFYFSRQFKQVTGATATGYRREAAPEP